MNRTLLVLWLALLLQYAHALFNFNGFRSRYHLNLQQAYKMAPKIFLTGDAQRETASVWFDQRIDISKGFSTSFSFSIESHGVGAAGMAFVLQDVSSQAVGNSDSGLGYAGMPKSLAVEFDTFQDEAMHDPDYQHISIHSRKTDPNTADEADAANYCALATPYKVAAPINTGTPHRVTVTYNATTTAFTVTFDGATVTPPNFLCNLGLVGFSGNMAYAGFTAATGAQTQNHYLESWSLYQEGVPCATQFITAACVPDTSNAKRECADLPDCVSCTTGAPPCFWSDNCIEYQSGVTGSGTKDQCPHKTSYTWVWILVAVAVVVLGTIITLWYFKRRASKQSLDASYGYL